MRFFIFQGKYVVKLLERFGMVDCKSMSTLMELNFKYLGGNIAGPVLFLDWYQEYVDICLGNNQPWAEIHCREFETPWIYRC